jgi:hypothetical protein
MIRTTTSVVGALLLMGASLRGQDVSDTTRRVLDLHALVEQHGPVVGPMIWPGFRPDTIPTLYVIAHRGKVLVQWRHEWPAGFTVTSERNDIGVAGSGMVSLPSGRFISFMSVDSSMSPGLVLGTSIHEAFHSFERSVMGEGRTFGSWENAMLVGTYPVFDVENEAAFALEGRKLRQALEAPTVDAARRRSREFIALRERRQRVLDSEFTEFEKKAELNEGLAQYALIRGLREIARLEGGPWEALARHEAAVESALLDSLLFLGQRSVRRRFYATGSAMALVLDRLAGASWKERLVRENLDLQEMLAVASGYDATGASETSSDRDALVRIRREAERAIGRLKAIRTAQADSIIRGAGILLSIDPRPLGDGALQWCGFDPQNTLQTGDGRTLHMRFLQVCAGNFAKGEFTRAIVQDDSSRVLSVAVDIASLRLTGRGQPMVTNDGEPIEVSDLVLEAENIRLEARRARVTRRGNALAVLLLDVKS